MNEAMRRRRPRAKNASSELRVTVTLLGRLAAGPWRVALGSDARDVGRAYSP